MSSAYQKPFAMSSFLKISGRIAFPLIKIHTVSVVTGSAATELVSDILRLM